MLDTLLKAARQLAKAGDYGVKVYTDGEGATRVTIDLSAAEGDAFTAVCGAAAEYFNPARSDSPCRKCGAPLTWIRTAAGKNAPLDAVTIEGLDADGAHQRIRLSHFSTCPAAASFKPGGNGRR